MGLTDRQSITPRFPKLGNLRKGGEKQNGKFGKDLDWLRFTSDRPGVESAFADIYGDQPTMLRIYLPFATPEECFETWKEEWGTGRTLKHRCDGVKVLRESKGGTYQDYSKSPYDQRPDCPGGCKETGRLTVILPELWKQGHIGYVTLETHSKHDLIKISASLLEAYQNRQDHALDLRGMEFTLRRQKETVSSPINGKRAETEKSLIEIEPSVNWARLQIAASQQQEQAMLNAASGQPYQVENVSGDGMEHDTEPPQFTPEQLVLIAEGDDLAVNCSEKVQWRWAEVKANGFKNGELQAAVDFLKSKQPEPTAPVTYPEPQEDIV